MANATINSAAFEPSMAIPTIVKNQRVSETNQNFGNIFNKASQNLEQSKTVQTSDQGVASQKEAVNQTETLNETTGQDETVKEISEQKNETLEATEEPVDEEIIEEVAGALKQIIEEIKEILGVSDEDVLNGMESIGIQPLDLLNSDNMAQLIAAITGEDSTISLVADEDMYAALQDIINAVDTQLSSLLESTGLTEEEWNAVLQKLADVITEAPETDAITNEVLSLENPAEDNLNEEIPLQTTKETVPVTITENKTTENKTEIPQIQQSAQNDANKASTVNLSVESQKTNEDQQDTRDYGQQQNSMAQNLENNLNEVQQMTTEAGVESYTSADTESILRQLADMVKIVKGEELTEMELQLHPASLGTVNVSLTTKGGVVTAEFVTQNEMVKNAIEAQAAQLQANLEEQGVKVEAIEVSVASHQMEKNLEEDSQGQQRSEQEQAANRVHGPRKNSINFNSFEDGDELLEEMQGADDATRIAMEMMAINGNSMDLLA